MAKSFSDLVGARAEIDVSFGQNVLIIGYDTSRLLLSDFQNIDSSGFEVEAALKFVSKIITDWRVRSPSGAFETFGESDDSPYGTSYENLKALPALFLLRVAKAISAEITVPKLLASN